jgi:hypothetical protein
MAIEKLLNSCSMLAHLGDDSKKCHLTYCLCKSINIKWLQLKFEILTSTIIQQAHFSLVNTDIAIGLSSLLSSA